MLLGLLPFALCWDVEVRWKMEEKLGEVFLWAERRRLPDRTVPVLSISKSSPWKASALATFVSLHQVEMLWTDNVFLEYSTFFFKKKKDTPPQQNPTTNQLKKKNKQQSTNPHSQKWYDYVLSRACVPGKCSKRGGNWCSLWLSHNSLFLQWGFNKERVVLIWSSYLGKKTPLGIWRMETQAHGSVGQLLPQTAWVKFTQVV